MKCPKCKKSININKWHFMVIYNWYKLIFHNKCIKDINEFLDWYDKK